MLFSPNPRPRNSTINRLMSFAPALLASVRARAVRVATATTAISINGGDDVKATTRIKWRQRRQQHNNQLILGNRGRKVGLHSGGGGGRGHAVGFGDDDDVTRQQSAMSATATQQKSSNAELIICCSGRGGNKCNKLLIAMAA